MGYRYETHLHTKQGSACGKSTGAEHARAYHRLGYTGIIVTDHFFGGNTAVDRSLPWDRKIETFCSGYEDARREGEKLGLDVFFAWEETFQGDDYLIYGLDMEWLLQHPEVEGCTRREQFDLVHEAGGCVIQAHPFRCRNYIHEIHLAKHLVDGVEVANAGNEPLWDYYAKKYADTYGMLMTAGSDNHDSASGAPLFAVETDTRLKSINDYVQLILSGKQQKLIVPDHRFDPVEEKKLPLKSMLLNTSDQQQVPYHPSWLYD